MSGSLTDEQRQRIEANRQKALQKKRHQPSNPNNSASIGSINCNEVNSSSYAIAPYFDYNEVPSSYNPSVRESYGDNNIDWDEVIQLENQRQSTNVTSNQANKRKLESSMHTASNLQSKRAPLIENSYKLKGSADHYNAINNKAAAPSELTEEQKIRIEQNRLRALEKKKELASRSAVTHSSTNAAHTLRENLSRNQTNLLSNHHNGRIEVNRPQVPESIKHAPKYDSGTNTSTVSILTDDQRALVEQKRQLALKKKQSLSMSKTHATTEHNTSCTLSDEQRTQIEQKKLAALQKKQSRLNPSTSLSHPQHPNDQNLRELQYNAQANLSTANQPLAAANSSCTILAHQMEQTSSTTSSNRSSSLTDEQKDLIEKRRIAALEMKQVKEASRNTQCKVTSELNSTDQKMSHDPLPRADNQQIHQDLHTLVKSVPQEQFEVATTATQPITAKNPKLQSPTKIKHKESELPKIPSDLQYDKSRCLPVEDEFSDSLIENAELDLPLLNGWSLYDHQKEGILRALQMRRLILAFDMGLGKTIIGCVWSKAFIKTFSAIKVFVISPVSLMEDWSRTAKDATGLNPQGGGKKKAKKSKAKKKRSSDDSDEEETNDNANTFIFSWSSVSDCKSILVDSPSNYVVICDEAHNMQSMSSKRTSDALKLLLGKKCQGVLLLSGTPMKNGKPSNLFPLLKAVKHPFGDEQKKYEFFFCNAQYKRMNGKEVWDASGSSNLNELHAHTSSHIFRKTKDECMSDELHPKKREYLKVPVSSRQELRYNQALKELANAFNAMHAARGSGCDANDTNILEPLNKLRQASSFAKIDAAVGLAKDLLEEEGSIVIFTSFVAVAKEVKQKLEDQSWAGQLLTGEVVAHKRQQMVDEFQEGVTPVFVCTYGAGGVGLTLTAACTVILVDRPWTPGDVNQAEDRVRRIGQKRPVRSIWIRAFPIDEQIDSLIDHKEVTSSTAVDGVAGDGMNKSAPKISISELVKTALSTPASSAIEYNST
ncbi:hypothetical protein ACHAWO_001408 [Cyclotella atomus]|uniref:Uncharacterized protein n=1 Tax=Cyclotella atomus TaxID=382360 RepID=A0ABD3QCT4_9STRA